LTKLNDEKPKILLGYLSSDLEDFFTRFVVPAGYEVRGFTFKEPAAILDNARWADAIFIQWDGRGQMGSELIDRINRATSGLKANVSIFGITTSKFKIETLPPKLSRLANISGWYELPDDKDQLLLELSLLMPDEYDDFKADISQSDLEFLHELPLESLRGKHLIGLIQKSWDERLHRAKTVTRIKDEILRSHVTFFHEDSARTNDLNSFLTDVRFKYHDEFSDLDTCMRWIRGHGTDCIVVWYDEKSHKSATLLRMYTESRHFPRIPLVVLYAADADLEHFKSKCGDLFVDKFIKFDRNREKFRTALIDAFELIGKDHGDRRLLDELRSQSLDFPPAGYKALSLLEIDAACNKIAAEPKKKYWADVERLLGFARHKDLTRFAVAVTEFVKNYKNFDAHLSIMISSCVASKEYSDTATRNFFDALASMGDLTLDRISRASLTMIRINAVDALKKILNAWWQSKDKFQIGHEFYFAASRWAGFSNLISLERILLALAIKGDPLRNEYVEAYANHLLNSGHPRHALQIGDYLSLCEYFPFKRARMISINAHLALGNKTSAISVIDELITRLPSDNTLAAIKAKITRG
jgi:hypothetical protein